MFFCSDSWKTDLRRGGLTAPSDFAFLSPDGGRVSCGALPGWLREMRGGGSGGASPSPRKGLKSSHTASPDSESEGNIVTAPCVMPAVIHTSPISSAAAAELCSCSSRMLARGSTTSSAGLAVASDVSQVGARKDPGAKI